MSKSSTAIMDVYGGYIRELLQASRWAEAFALRGQREITLQLGRIADALEAQSEQQTDDLRRADLDQGAAERRRIKSIARDLELARDNMAASKIRAGLETAEERESRESDLEGQRAELRKAVARKRAEGERRQELIRELSNLPEGLRLNFLSDAGLHHLNLWAERVARSPKLFDYLIERISEIDTAAARGTE